MDHIVVFDYDKFLMDNSRRMKIARGVATFVDGIYQEAEDSDRDLESLPVNWGIYFLPELVVLDTPLPGAMEAFSTFREPTWFRVILTSNIGAQMHVMLHHRLNDCLHEGDYPLYQLVNKPREAQFMKTRNWKTIQLCGTQACTLLPAFTENEGEICSALTALSAMTATQQPFGFTPLSETGLLGEHHNLVSVIVGDDDEKNRDTLTPVLARCFPHVLTHVCADIPAMLAAKQMHEAMDKALEGE